MAPEEDGGDEACFHAKPGQGQDLGLTADPARGDIARQDQGFSQGQDSYPAARRPSWRPPF